MNKKNFKNLLNLYNYDYGINKIEKLSFKNNKDFTRNSKKSLMSDNEFMKIFPNLNYETLDKSNYENAEKILDLNSSSSKKIFKNNMTIFSTYGKLR